MQPHRPAQRRQPANVYRLRRALAATAGVLVVFAVLNLVGAGGGSDDDTADTTVPETTTTTIPPVPACAEGDFVVPEDPATQWATVMLDTARAIPDSYAPNDLRNLADAGFPLTDGLAVRSLVVDDLAAFRQAATDNGTPLSILAAYRSYADQADLLERRVGEFGEETAASRVARPGHSEHQLGTAIDVTTEGETDVDQSWGATPHGQWVATNAHKFGFLLSYPMEATARTCYDYEPWHLRYVGRDQAAKVIASGLSLREHLWQQNPVDITAAPAPTTTVP